MAYNPVVGVKNTGNVQIDPATQGTLAAGLDVALSTRLKPADTLTKVATVDTITNPVKVAFTDSQTTDAFSRLRVSSPVTLFETQTQYNANPLRMEAGKTSDGVVPAWSSSTRLVTLQINAGGAGGSSFMQSYQYHPYQPGKSQFIFMTGVLGTGTAGAVKRFGYGDAANGIFYEQNGVVGIQFNRRTSTSGVVVDNTVAQASWNLDKLDGTGASGITLDVTKDFILVIDLQFLSMGRVRIGFDIAGVIVYAHQFLHANVISVPYMQTASLPVLAEIIAAAGLAGAATCQFKCATVMSEGGFETGLGRMFCTGNTSITAQTSRTHALSIRPKTTFNGIANRSDFVLTGLDVMSGANQVVWELCIGVGFTVAPTYVDVNTTYSAFEVGTGGTVPVLTNGIVIESGYVPTGGAAGRVATSQDLSISYPITLSRAGAVRDLGTLTLLLTSFTGTSACQCTMHWVEIR